MKRKAKLVPKVENVGIVPEAMVKQLEAVGLSEVKPKLAKIQEAEIEPENNQEVNQLATVTNPKENEVIELYLSGINPTIAFKKVFNRDPVNNEEYKIVNSNKYILQKAFNKHNINHIRIAKTLDHVLKSKNNNDKLQATKIILDRIIDNEIEGMGSGNINIIRNQTLNQFVVEAGK
jgi:hypothetical protein